MELKDLLALAQGGGSVGLLVACWFIWRATERLARIEMMLELHLLQQGILPPKPGADRNEFLERARRSGG